MTPHQKRTEPLAATREPSLDSTHVRRLRSSRVMRTTFVPSDTDRSRALGRLSPRVHSGAVRIVFLILVFAACGGTSHPNSRATTGGIAGLARDHDSGDPVAKAEIRVRASGEL